MREVEVEQRAKSFEVKEKEMALKKKKKKITGLRAHDGKRCVGDEG